MGRFGNTEFHSLIGIFCLFVCLFVFFNISLFKRKKKLDISKICGIVASDMNSTKVIINFLLTTSERLEIKCDRALALEVNFIQFSFSFFSKFPFLSFSFCFSSNGAHTHSLSAEFEVQLRVSSQNL